MKYEIFEGKSSLRHLTKSESRSLTLSLKEREYKQTQILINKHKDDKNTLVLPILIFLLKGKLDIAHELILGETTQNIADAEYAATHPGETSWSVDHALTTIDDILHCIVHRFEGINKSKEGGGIYAGYDNAKFWVAGGDKGLEYVADHKLWHHMKEYVTKHHERFHCLGLVAPIIQGCTTRDERKYEIIASKGKKRFVPVKAGMWDEFRFIDLCALRYGCDIDKKEKDVSHDDLPQTRIKINSSQTLDWNEQWRDLIDELQLVQIEYLLRYAFKLV